MTHALCIFYSPQAPDRLSPQRLDKEPVPWCQRAEVRQRGKTVIWTVSGHLVGLTDDWMSRQVASWACSLG